MAYATFSDLDRYYEMFSTRYYGDKDNPAGTLYIDYEQMQADLNTSYEKINNMLDGIERIPFIPIGTNPITGSYNPFLVEWNACDVIYTKLRARHSAEFRSEIPEWIMRYGSRCIEIYDDIANGRIIFYTDITNRGIGYPIKVNQAGIAYFYTNWDTGFYSASDYQREYRIRITEGGNDINSCMFKYSSDAGYSYTEEEYSCGTDWVDIEYGLAVRWSYGYGAGTQLVVGDEWKVICIPNNIRTVQRGARFTRFKVG